MSWSLPTSPQITLPLAQNFPTTLVFSLFFPSFPTLFSLYLEYAKPLHTSFILVFTKFSFTFSVKLPSTPLYHRLWVIRQINYVIIYLINAISSRLWAPYRGLISFAYDYISLPTPPLPYASHTGHIAVSTAHLIHSWVHSTNIWMLKMLSWCKAV